MPRSFIFDLDATLITKNNDYVHVAFPQVRGILQSLYFSGHSLYVASFNSFAEDILRQLNLLHYFCAVADLVSDSSKPKIIRQLALDHQIDLSQARFFDDDPYNVQECQAINLHTTKVDPLVGVTWEQIEYALR